MGGGSALGPASGRELSQARGGRGWTGRGARTRSVLKKPPWGPADARSTCRTTPVSSWTCMCRGNGELPPLLPLNPPHPQPTSPSLLRSLPQLRQQPYHWRQGPCVHPDERGRGELGGRRAYPLCEGGEVGRTCTLISKPQVSTRRCLGTSL